MNAMTASFYIAGGTIPGDAPSYVKRQADDVLYEGLKQSAFCYVLTARQMGKSSLMVRTVARLRADTTKQFRTVVLDLSAMGRNLTLEQWYIGLRDRVGRQLDLEDEMEDFWDAHRHLSPLQRFFAALEHIALAPTANDERRTTNDKRLTINTTPSHRDSLKTGEESFVVRRSSFVIFIDEIDFVRSLPFDTDEFFAAIRACHNQRASDPTFARLTFCLLGVASPVELIQNDHVTPFNIGQRIELTDFTLPEARGLAWGLHAESATAGRLLSRVLYWTGGHPYLTQKLCQSLVRVGADTDEEVDRVCAELFFRAEARIGESNLAFVANRFLNSGQDLSDLLDLYRKIVQGQHLPDNETSQLVSALKMTGIVRVEQGRLYVRNRIYARVFDRDWIREHTPDAERRRQRSAYRRGLLRASLVGGVALLLVGGLAFYAMQQTRNANEARERLQQTLGAIYESDMNTAQREWAQGNPGRVAQIVERYRANWNERNPPPFLWRYFWGLVHQEAATLRGHTGPISSVACSPDNRWMASGSLDKCVIVWDASTRKVVWKSSPLPARVTSVAFSPNSSLLAAGGGSDRKSWVQIWNASDGSPLQSLPLDDCAVRALAFSPEGKTLATGCSAGDGEGRGQVTLWEVATWRRRVEITENVGTGHTLDFSPDGSLLATASDLPRNNAVRLWDSANGNPLRTLLAKPDRQIAAVRFSPEGKSLAAAEERTIVLWDVSSGRPRRRLEGHTGRVSEVDFGPEGRTLVSAGWDDTLRLWNLAARKSVRTWRGQEDRVNAVAFSPNGKYLLSGGSDPVVRLWEVQQPVRTALPAMPTTCSSIRLAPNSRRMALTMRDGSIQIWDTDRWKPSKLLRERGKYLYAIGFTADSRELLVSVEGKAVKQWNLAADQTRQILSLPGAKEFFHALSPNGKMLAIGEPQNRTFRLWNLESRTECRVPFTYTDRPTGAVFSPDSRTLAVTLSDPQNRILLLDTATWEERKILAVVNGDPNTGHTNAVMQTAFSPDGKILASASADSSVILWDAATGACLQKIEAHRGTVSRLAYSPDGRTLATGGAQDRLVKMWDMERRRVIAVFTDHRHEITSLQFSADGRFLMSKDRTTTRFRHAPTFPDILAREQAENYAD